MERKVVTLPLHAAKHGQARDLALNPKGDHPKESDLIELHCALLCLSDRPPAGAPADFIMKASETVRHPTVRATGLY